MLQLTIAVLIALILLGVFSKADEGVVKRTIGKVLFWLVIAAIVIPLAVWLLATFGVFFLQVIVVFVVLRWLLSGSPPSLHK